MRDFLVDFFIDGQKKTLLFRGVITPTGGKYFVSAVPELENQGSFEMREQASNQWRIMAPAPMWAFRMEQQLSAAIVENNIPNRNE